MTRELPVAVCESGYMQSMGKLPGFKDKAFLWWSISDSNR